MFSKYFLRSAFLLPFFIAGCGEGYEMVRTDAYFPYGNQRTAGSAIAYVQARLLPKKDLVIPEPVVSKPVQRQQAPTPVEDTKLILDNLSDDMEEIFEDAQRK